MIVDCISDLHGHYPLLEGGDLLIVAGDLTRTDKFAEYQAFATWLSRQQYRKKIFIGGNHDNFLYDQRLLIMPLVGPQDLSGVEFLCDSGTEFEYYDKRFPEEDEGFLPSGKRTLKIWGSPWTQRFKGMNPKCMAFTLDTDEELAEKWALIPNDVDILVTHCPPFGILDITGNGPVGSKSLNYAIAKIKPKLIVFGHIHEQGGRIYDLMHTKFVNASHVNEHYEPVNKPIRIEL
jgi:predicted phosphodiesterase